MAAEPIENAAKFWSLLQLFPGNDLPSLLTNQFLLVKPHSRAPDSSSESCAARSLPPLPSARVPHAASLERCVSSSSLDPSILSPCRCSPMDTLLLSVWTCLTFITFITLAQWASPASPDFSTCPSPALTSLPSGGRQSISPYLRRVNWPQSPLPTTPSPSYLKPSRCWSVFFSPSPPPCPQPAWLLACLLHHYHPAPPRSFHSLWLQPMQALLAHNCAGFKLLEGFRHRISLEPDRLCCTPFILPCHHGVPPLWCCLSGRGISRGQSAPECAFSELSLPCPYRIRLSQLNLGFCSALQSYRHKVDLDDSDICP